MRSGSIEKTENTLLVSVISLYTFHIFKKIKPQKKKKKKQKQKQNPTLQIYKCLLLYVCLTTLMDFLNTSKNMACKKKRGIFPAGL